MRIALFLAVATALQGAPPPHPGYERRSPHDPNGIGKFYLGREIAHVMGHPAAAWLERPEREQEEAPSKAIEALDLKPGMVVADVGVGTGYHAFRIAPKLGETGRVLGVDIQPEMLAKLKAKAESLGVRNVQGVLGTVQDPKLPKEGVDLVLMVDVYHEFEFPYEMMTAIRSSLKPGGRVALVEFRKEDPKVPIKDVHKMSEAQIRKEMEVVGLKWLKTVDTLPWQHLVIFGK
ncbi:MAG TPA: class I SAM-dependent methyltransferase [Planctomycetota bacterium]|nr:class I SAM-dependent methyltransferase [Planctomycetota bacterium]